MEETIEYSEVKLQRSLSKTLATMNVYYLKAGLALDVKTPVQFLGQDVPLVKRIGYPLQYC